VLIVQFRMKMQPSKSPSLRPAALCRGFRTLWTISTQK
jgi:hypothetical protein